MSDERNEDQVRELRDELRYYPSKEWESVLNSKLLGPYRPSGMPERLDLGGGSSAQYNHGAGQWVVNHPFGG